MVGCRSVPSAGDRELMAELAPGGPVYQAGTLSGNPLATAAGLAVLDAVTPADYEALAARVALFAKESRVGGGERRPGCRRPDGGTAGRPVRGTRPTQDRSRRRRTTRARGRSPRERRTPASSTPCSAGAWRWRRAPTR